MPQGHGNGPAVPSRSSVLVLFASTLARVGLAAVWLVAGFLKLRADPELNVVAVRAYRLLPEVLVRPLAAAQPPLEAALGVLLLVGLATRLAASASAVAFALYIGGIAWVWAHGYKIDCGCFSQGGEDASVTGRTYALEIARDVGFVLLALWLSVRPWSWFALGPRSRARLESSRARPHDPDEESDPGEEIETSV